MSWRSFVVRFSKGVLAVLLCLAAVGLAAAIGVVLALGLAMMAG